MNRLDPKRVTVFICVMTTIAIVIYGTQHRQQEKFVPTGRPQIQQAPTIATPQPEPIVQQPTPTPAITPEQQRAKDAAVARKAAEDAAAEHAKFVARYLSASIFRKPGIKTVAIVAVSENGEFDSVVGDAMAAKFKADSVETVSGLFTPSFISDGLFSKAFGGSMTALDKLDLTDSLDALLLARETVNYTTNPSSLANVLTATMRLELTLMPVASKGRKQTWAFTASGAGFKQTDARAMAEERLLKQIASSPELSLPQTP